MHTLSMLPLWYVTALLSLFPESMILPGLISNSFDTFAIASSVSCKETINIRVKGRSKQTEIQHRDGRNELYAIELSD